MSNVHTVMSQASAIISVVWLADLATASYDSVNFSLASQTTSPFGFTFGDDGSKMYVVSSAPDTVFQYSLSTAYNMSTASYDSVSFSISGQLSDPNGIFLGDSGTKMYVIGLSTDKVFQYSLSTAYDLSTATYDSVEFSVSGQETTPQDLYFSPDGTKMYIVGFTDKVFQYTLSTAYDLSTASYDSVEFSVTSQVSLPTAVVVSSEGSKMYVVDRSTDDVFQYSLSTAFDIGTASYDSVSFSTTAQTTNPQGLNFNADGTKMYVLMDNDLIYQYTTA